MTDPIVGKNAMELTQFTFRLILIFIPGLIAFIIVDGLTVHKETRFYSIVVYSLLLGFLCYFCYYLISLIPKLGFEFSFIQNLTDKDTRLNFKEILIATTVSVPIGLLFSLVINQKVLHRIAHFLRISKKFGDLDVWSYVMNLKIPEWVVIRDIENDLMYEGWIQAFSDAMEEKALFLRDVKVYKQSSAEFIYQVPAMYLPAGRDGLLIQFPSLESGNQEETNWKEGQQNDKKNQGGHDQEGRAQP